MLHDSMGLQSLSLSLFSILIVNLIFLIFLIYFQNAVLALDSSALDIDQVENLIKFCPTKEEMETLRVIYFTLIYTHVCVYLYMYSHICICGLQSLEYTCNVWHYVMSCCFDVLVLLILVMLGF